jgi:hypothetical protein
MPPKSNKTGDTSSLPNDGTELLKNVIDGHKTITLRALDVIPQSQRYAVYVLWTIVVLTVIGGIIFRASTSGLVLFLVAFVTIIISFFVLNKEANTSPEQLGQLTAGQVSGPTWARVVPKMPISPPEKLNQFQISLRELRNLAVTKLNEERNKLNEARKKGDPGQIASESVRLNVFMVNTDRVAEFGEVCGLFIPKQMHDNMDNFPDRNVRFRPHEGLTGRTFTLGEASGANAASDASGKLAWKRFNLFPQRPGSDEWDKFNLSEEQIAAIDQKLRWIVSFPLRYDGTGSDKTFAVLNIDGLDNKLTGDEMRLLAANIEPNVNKFAAELGTLPKVRIAIRVEDVA